MIKKIDIILISTRWYPIDFDGLNDTIINLKSNYKKIILGSSRPEFPTIYNYTYADKFLLENRRFPNKKEKKDLEKLYFQFFNDELKIKVFNKKLKEVAYVQQKIVLVRCLIIVTKKYIQILDIYLQGELHT